MQFLPHFIFRSPLNSSQKNIDESVFAEALYLSTPALYDECQKHLIKPLTDAKELKKLNISLYKYQTRASHRCTPFGLFAGLGIGNWDNENNITLNADLKETLKRKTRLDMNVLFSLAQELVKKEYIQPHLKFYPNTSIYKVGEAYRYIEYYYNNNRRFHKINRVDFTEYLQFILSESKKGLTKAEISNLLISDEISLEEATPFVDELIASQIIIHQLEPTVTGNDYFDVLFLNLQQLQASQPSNELQQVIELLAQVNLLIKVNDEAVFNAITTYKHIHAQLKTLLPELSETNLFQTDLYKTPTAKTLHSDLQKQLTDTITFLNKISPPNKNSTLDEFKKRFTARYEDYEIPLLIALDTESGVGYPNNDTAGVNDLVEGVFAMGDANNESDIKWNMLQSYLLKLITDSIKDNKKVIELTEEDFKNIDYSKGNLPSTFSVMFKVINATSQKIDLNSIGGSSAINLLGRFAGGDEHLGNIVNNIAEFEQAQHPDKILAEIVHLPESRTGNILARPSFRKYEIPYLAKSTVDDALQIKVENLTLKVKGDNIILFDTQLQKEIIPRLGNAHNFSYNSLPIYHFLCDLQNQYVAKPYVGFNWGALANQFDFLPRVEYKNTVLSSAKWTLRKNQLEPLQDKKKLDADKITAFFDLQKKIQLPNRFLIVEADNELLIDCTNPVAVDTFIDNIKHKNEITLEEYLFEDEHALVKDSNGNSYTNECIAIVLNPTETKTTTQPEIKVNTFISKQTFALGSEWLYYKIYCGAKTADYILTEKLKPIADKLIDEGVIDKWFFIRYSDPDIHLRFRLHFLNFDKYGYALQLINEELEPLMGNHSIFKIQTDTYKRELERYGDNSMELVEQLFTNDSIFVSDMLAMLDAESGSTLRWQMAIRSVDELLTDFKLTPEEKLNLIDRLNTSFFNDHGGKKELKVILDTKFRTLRKQVEDVLNKTNETEKEYYPLIEALNQRTVANKPTIEILLQLDKAKELQLSLFDLLASVLHMNLDRLFMGRNRTNEFVVYDLLFRYYKSSLARIKSESKKQNPVA